MRYRIEKGTNKKQKQNNKKASNLEMNLLPACQNTLRIYSDYAL